MLSMNVGICMPTVVGENRVNSAPPSPTNVHRCCATCAVRILRPDSDARKSRCRKKTRPIRCMTGLSCAGSSMSEMHLLPRTCTPQSLAQAHNTTLLCADSNLIYNPPAGQAQFSDATNSQKDYNHHHSRIVNAHLYPLQHNICNAWTKRFPSPDPGPVRGAAHSNAEYRRPSGPQQTTAHGWDTDSVWAYVGRTPENLGRTVADHGKRLDLQDRDGG